jgi:hypothetical protein
MLFKSRNGRWWLSACSIVLSPILLFNNAPGTIQKNNVSSCWSARWKSAYGWATVSRRMWDPPFLPVAGAPPARRSLGKSRSCGGVLREVSVQRPPQRAVCLKPFRLRSVARFVSVSYRIFTEVLEQLRQYFWSGLERKLVRILSRPFECEN